MSDARDDIGEVRLFDGAFYFLCGITVVSGAVALWVHGPGVVPEALGRLAADSVMILPQVVLGIVVGALFTMLVPREIVARFLGRQAGLRGILLATALGTVMPGGPFAAFPIVYALGRSGAGVGALIAFLVAWAAVGLSRLLIWELPFMGPEFAMLRFVCSLPLPVLAGIFADRLSRGFAVFRMRWE